MPIKSERLFASGRTLNFEYVNYKSKDNKKTFLINQRRVAAMKFTKTGKVVFVAIGLAIIYLSMSWGIRTGVLPGTKSVASSIPEKARLADFRGTSLVKSGGTVPALVLPKGELMLPPAGVPSIRMKIWAWNAQAGLIFANGGPSTTAQSLMAKHGVHLTLERQDDTNILRDELLACAKELSDGKQDCEKGIHFTIVMGDQLGAQLAGWNPTFKKLGDDLTIEVVGLAGRSDGEDAYLAPPSVKFDPKMARGTTVICALREGDQNIVIYWAAQNGIPVNPDPRVYDPNAINFMAAESYTKASEMYNAGVCEDRPVVQKGLRTGERKKVCGDSVATWTPGDVTATVSPSAKGGLVRVWSTRENSSQMPATIIGIKRWNASHPELVKSMLSAIFEGGDQLKFHNEALLKAMELSAQLYNEETSKYWYRYFVGVEEIDAQGNKVQLGGSQVFNLADNATFFGLESGQANLLKTTYETFGGYMKSYYPSEVPEIAPYREAVNARFVQALQQAASPTEGGASSVVQAFRSEDRISEVGTRKSWTIEFDPGKATFTPRTSATLEVLHDALVISQNLLVEIHGHTDSTGGIDANQALSEARAFAVKSYLEAKSPTNFPSGRIRVVAHGQTQPLVPNDTAEGRARNRRVEVVTGK